jgi:hypothetical protein
VRVVDDMIKKIWECFSSAMGWGSFIMALDIVRMYLTGSDGLQSFFHNPIPNIIGYLVIGLGFFGSTIVYEFENISSRLKLVIHIITGVTLFLLVAFYLGWGITEDPVGLLHNIALYVGIVLVVWVVLYFRDKKDVEEINKTLHEQNHKKPLDTE